MSSHIIAANNRRRAVSLAAAGKTTEEIAKEIGCRRHRACEYLRQAGVKAVKPIYSNVTEDVNYEFKCITCGKDSSYLARVFSSGRVNGIAKRICDDCTRIKKREWERRKYSRSPRPNFWTQERKEKVKELFNLDLSCREIGEHFGKSKGAIIGILFRMDLLGKKPKPIRKAKVYREKKVARMKPPTLKPLPISKRLEAILLPRPNSLNIPFRATKSRQCRYMEGTDHLCCGHETRVGLSWCDFHFLVVYRNDRRTTPVANINQQSMANS